MLQNPQQLSISITPKAAEKVRTLMEKQGAKDAALRVFISGGGCSGFRYGMAFDKTKEDDSLVESNGIKIAVDQDSAQYLAGAEIDYVESVMGEGFMVNNPNAGETCGCGHSFKPK